MVISLDDPGHDTPRRWWDHHGLEEQSHLEVPQYSIEWFRVIWNANQLTFVSLALLGWCLATNLSTATCTVVISNPYVPFRIQSSLSRSMVSGHWSWVMNKKTWRLVTPRMPDNTEPRTTDHGMLNHMSWVASPESLTSHSLSKTNRVSKLIWRFLKSSSDSPDCFAIRKPDSWMVSVMW